MLAAPSTALPLKILIAEDAQGKVWLSYNSPEYLKERHGLPTNLLQNIAVVETLAAEAAKQVRDRAISGPSDAKGISDMVAKLRQTPHSIGYVGISFHHQRLALVIRRLLSRSASAMNSTNGALMCRCSTDPAP
jgi:hypothetical protein